MLRTSIHQGDQHARGACIEVQVEAVLTLILVVVVAIIRRVAVVVLVVTVLMVSVMRVPILIMVVYMNENARERSSRRCKGYADCRRDSKRQRHRPKEGDTASACSIHSRQHAFR